tara:strand:+ start:119 stop:814 length:696 start_codon:yes stop_codon:yes gene_type:complete
MKSISIIFLASISFYVISDNHGSNKESNNYKYTSIGLHAIKSEKSGFALKVSVDLPGSFYAVLQRQADGIDYENESYDKVIDSARLGLHMGIGDIFESIATNNFEIKIKNFFDVFAELGVKTSDFDGERFNFEGNDTHASFIAGIRFGNSNGWEGKIFVDTSKEAMIIDSGNPTCKALSCPPYDAELSDDADKKFGIGILYNINNRSAFIIEASSSKLLDQAWNIGYQVNF